jgi:hypothetical protein
MILPPVIDRENLKKELFGNYKKEIKKLINEKKIDIKRLTAIASREIKKKEFLSQKAKRKTSCSYFKFFIFFRKSCI